MNKFKRILINVTLSKSEQDDIIQDVFDNINNEGGSITCYEEYNNDSSAYITLIVTYTV